VPPGSAGQTPQTRSKGQKVKVAMKKSWFPYDEVTDVDQKKKEKTVG
jgi:hypothetical protein